MNITRGSDNRKVSFGSLRGGENFLGSVTGRKLKKLARPTSNGKNCALIESGELRKVSGDEIVERCGALKVPFHTLQVGSLFRGTQTPAVFQKTATVRRADGKKSNCVRIGTGSINYYYISDAMVEPLSGDLEVSGR